MLLKEVQIVLVFFQNIWKPLSGAIFVFKINILIYRWIKRWIKFFAECFLKKCIFQKQQPVPTLKTLQAGLYLMVAGLERSHTQL